MRLINTNLLNYFYKNGVKPIKDSLAKKLDTAKLSNNLLTTASGYGLDARQGPVLKKLIDDANSNLSELNGRLGVVSKVKQSGSKTISKETWTNILSTTLAAGTYIIVGQANVSGSTETYKYIEIRDTSEVYNAIENLSTILYGQVTTILELTSTRTISVAAFSYEIATVTNAELSVIKIK